jgi:cysteine synthase B
MSTDYRARVYDSIMDMFPSEQNPTPLVRLRNLVPANSTLYAKLEWMNPYGSVKDRAAREMIEDLEARGELGPARPGRGIVEPTSGNTGLSLAGLASLKGYPMRAVVPAKVPEEKRMLLKHLGATVDVTNDATCPLPGSEDGAIGLAKTYARAQSSKYVMPNQYENEANVRAHERTTGPEIWNQTAGKVTHIFTALGTVGTATGLARYMKTKNPLVKIIAVQPSAGHKIPGVRNASELGVSKLFDPSLISEIVEIPHEIVNDAARELFRKEGLRAGPSSGLIFEGSRKVAARDGVGLGVMIFCDDVFKYIHSMMPPSPD